MNPVFPSILNTNFFNLEERLQVFKDNGIDTIHLDVMDGHFVDNISFGPSVVSSIKSKFDFIMDSHLMVSNPEKMIPEFIRVHSDWISFHVETGKHILKNIGLIKENERNAGLVLNPDTPIEWSFPFLKFLDYILLMSVFPGYGGQSFIEETIGRTAELRNQIDKSGAKCMIQVDGGINTSNIGRLKDAGADLFVVGTFLYHSEDIPQTIHNILDRLN